MEIQVSELIPALSYVYVRLEGVGIEAYGKVRHANRRGTIGVEFAEGRVWNYAKAGMK
jgi:hypothetical protein